MEIRDIPFLGPNHRGFTIREGNAILLYLRQLVRSSPGRRSDGHGIASPDTKNPTPGITVMFDADYDPYSVFAVAMTSSSPYFYVLNAVQEVITNPNTDSINRNKGVIYCTNEGYIAKNGATLSCAIIGYETPRLVKYSGTEPDIGDKCYPVPSQKYVTVNENGPFLIVSKPDTDRELVWICRHERILEIYGTADSTINYGSNGNISVFRDLADSGDTASVMFKFLGKTGDTIPSGAKVHARWFDDLNNGVGGWLVTNSNCEV